MFVGKSTLACLLCFDSSYMISSYYAKTVKAVSFFYSHLCTIYTYPLLLFLLVFFDTPHCNVMFKSKFCSMYLQLPSFWLDDKNDNMA